uniref:Reverse transcriptase domain-containing protein n=1 Tax=Cyprinus carpio TaxID=7962 RepID=A0A8C2DQL5_CYPCA
MKSDCPVILVLLDLMAAFDTVDHEVLLSRLNHFVGIRGTALQWFSSYLTNRTFSVVIGGSSFSTTSLSCGVPQGSILWPILFSLYMLPLGSIIARDNIAFHCGSLIDCNYDIKLWLEHSFLHLNEERTEYILFGESVTSDFDALTLVLRQTVRNLGVTFDSSLKFDKLTACLKLIYFSYVIWPRSNHF